MKETEERISYPVHAAKVKVANRLDPDGSIAQSLTAKLDFMKDFLDRHKPKQNEDGTAQS